MHSGFSGHRPDRHRIWTERVNVRLSEALALTQSEAVGTPAITITAMAEGSDRLFAEATLDLGFQVDALLPMPIAECETTFEDAATTTMVRQRLARSSEIWILTGSLADSKATSETLGHSMVAGCDVLLCVGGWQARRRPGRHAQSDHLRP